MQTTQAETKSWAFQIVPKIGGGIRCINVFPTPLPVDGKMFFPTRAAAIEALKPVAARHESACMIAQS